MAPAPQLKPFSPQHLNPRFLANVVLVLETVFNHADFKWRDLAQFLSTPSQTSRDAITPLAKLLNNPQEKIVNHEQFSFTLGDKKALRYLILAFIMDIVAYSQILAGDDIPHNWQEWEKIYLDHLSRLYENVPRQYKQESVVFHLKTGGFSKWLIPISISLILLFYGTYSNNSTPEPPPPSESNFVQKYGFHLLSETFQNIGALFACVITYFILNRGKSSTFRFDQFQTPPDTLTLSQQQMRAVDIKYKLLALLDKFAKLSTSLQGKCSNTFLGQAPNKITIDLGDSLQGSEIVVPASIPESPTLKLRPDPTVGF